MEEKSKRSSDRERGVPGTRVKSTFSTSSQPDIVTSLSSKKSLNYDTKVLTKQLEGVVDKEIDALKIRRSQLSISENESHQYRSRSREIFKSQDYNSPAKNEQCERPSSSKSIRKSLDQNHSTKGSYQQIKEQLECTSSTNSISTLFEQIPGRPRSSISISSKSLDRKSSSKFAHIQEQPEHSSSSISISSQSFDRKHSYPQIQKQLERPSSSNATSQLHDRKPSLKCTCPRREEEYERPSCSTAISKTCEPVLKCTCVYNDSTTSESHELEQGPTRSELLHLRDVIQHNLMAIKTQEHKNDESNMMARKKLLLALHSKYYDIIRKGPKPIPVKKSSSESFEESVGKNIHTNLEKSSAASINRIEMQTTSRPNEYTAFTSEQKAKCSRHCWCCNSESTVSEKSCSSKQIALMNNIKLHTKTIEESNEQSSRSEQENVRSDDVQSLMHPYAQGDSQSIMNELAQERALSNLNKLPKEDARSIASSSYQKRLEASNDAVTPSKTVNSESKTLHVMYMNDKMDGASSNETNIFQLNQKYSNGSKGELKSNSVGITSSPLNVPTINETRQVPHKDEKTNFVFKLGADNQYICQSNIDMEVLDKSILQVLKNVKMPRLFIPQRKQKASTDVTIQKKKSSKENIRFKCIQIPQSLSYIKSWGIDLDADSDGSETNTVPTYSHFSNDGEKPTTSSKRDAGGSDIPFPIQPVEIHHNDGNNEESTRYVESGNQSRYNEYIYKEEKPSTLRQRSSDIPIPMQPVHRHLNDAYNPQSTHYVESRQVSSDEEQPATSRNRAPVGSDTPFPIQAVQIHHNDVNNKESTRYVESGYQSRYNEYRYKEEKPSTLRQRSSDIPTPIQPVERNLNDAYNSQSTHYVESRHQVNSDEEQPATSRNRAPVGSDIPFPIQPIEIHHNDVNNKESTRYVESGYQSRYNEYRYKEEKPSTLRQRSSDIPTPIQPVERNLNDAYNSQRTHYVESRQVSSDEEQPATSRNRAPVGSDKPFPIQPVQIHHNDVNNKESTRYIESGNQSRYNEDKPSILRQRSSDIPIPMQPVERRLNDAYNAQRTHYVESRQVSSDEEQPATSRNRAPVGSDKPFPIQPVQIHHNDVNNKESTSYVESGNQSRYNEYRYKEEKPSTLRQRSSYIPTPIQPVERNLNDAYNSQSTHYVESRQVSSDEEQPATSRNRAPVGSDKPFPIQPVQIHHNDVNNKESTSYIEFGNQSRYNEDKPSILRQRSSDIPIPMQPVERRLNDAYNAQRTHYVESRQVSSDEEQPATSRNRAPVGSDKPFPIQPVQIHHNDVNNKESTRYIESGNQSRYNEYRYKEEKPSTLRQRSSDIPTPIQPIERNLNDAYNSQSTHYVESRQVSSDEEQPATSRNRAPVGSDTPFPIQAVQIHHNDVNNKESTRYIESGNQSRYNEYRYKEEKPSTLRQRSSDIPIPMQPVHRHLNDAYNAQSTHYVESRQVSSDEEQPSTSKQRERGGCELFLKRTLAVNKTEQLNHQIDYSSEECPEESMSQHCYDYDEYYEQTDSKNFSSYSMEQKHIPEKSMKRYDKPIELLRTPTPVKPEVVNYYKYKTQEYEELASCSYSQNRECRPRTVFSYESVENLSDIKLPVSTNEELVFAKSQKTKYSGERIQESRKEEEQEPEPPNICISAGRLPTWVSCLNSVKAENTRPKFACTTHSGRVRNLRSEMGPKYCRDKTPAKSSSHKTTTKISDTTQQCQDMNSRFSECDQRLNSIKRSFIHNSTKQESSIDKNEIPSFITAAEVHPHQMRAYTDKEIPQNTASNTFTKHENNSSMPSVQKTSRKDSYIIAETRKPSSVNLIDKGLIERKRSKDRNKNIVKASTEFIEHSPAPTRQTKPPPPPPPISENFQEPKRVSKCFDIRVEMPQADVDDFMSEIKSKRANVLHLTESAEKDNFPNVVVQKQHNRNAKEKILLPLCGELGTFDERRKIIEEHYKHQIMTNKSNYYVKPVMSKPVLLATKSSPSTSSPAKNISVSIQTSRIITKKNRIRRQSIRCIPKIRMNPKVVNSYYKPQAMEIGYVRHVCWPKIITHTWEKAIFRNLQQKTQMSQVRYRLGPRVFTTRELVRRVDKLVLNIKLNIVLQKVGHRIGARICYTQEVVRCLGKAYMYVIEPELFDEDDEDNEHDLTLTKCDLDFQNEINTHLMILAKRQNIPFVKKFKVYPSDTKPCIDYGPRMIRPQKKIRSMKIKTDEKEFCDKKVQTPSVSSSLSLSNRLSNNLGDAPTNQLSRPFYRKTKDGRTEFINYENDLDNMPSTSKCCTNPYCTNYHVDNSKSHNGATMPSTSGYAPKRNIHNQWNAYNVYKLKFPPKNPMEKDESMLTRMYNFIFGSTPKEPNYDDETPLIQSSVCDLPFSLEVLEFAEKNNLLKGPNSPDHLFLDCPCCKYSIYPNYKYNTYQQAEIDLVDHLLHWLQKQSYYIFPPYLLCICDVELFMQFLTTQEGHPAILSKTLNYFQIKNIYLKHISHQQRNKQ